MKTYHLHNFSNGQNMKKTQVAAPKVKGFTVVDVEPALPEQNAKGERLFRDAQNRPYYATVDGDGSHRQP